jgi:hypothetical protein
MSEEARSRDRAIAQKSADVLSSYSSAGCV